MKKVKSRHFENIMILGMAPLAQFIYAFNLLVKSKKSAKLYAIAGEDIYPKLHGFYKEKIEEIFIVKRGLFLTKEIDKNMRDKIRAKEIDLMVIPGCPISLVLDNSFALRLAFYLNIPNVILICDGMKEKQYNRIGMMLYILYNSLYTFLERSFLFVAKKVLPHDYYAATCVLLNKLKTRYIKQTESIHFKGWPDEFPKDRTKGMPLKISPYYKNALMLNRLSDSVRLYTFNYISRNGIELAKGVKHDISVFANGDKVTLPICLPLINNINYGKLRFNVDGDEIKMEQVACGCWYYFTLDQNWKNTTLESENNEIVLGEPIYHKPAINHAGRPKCVILLAVDSISQSILNEYSLESLMPHTYDFFKKGRLFNNHWCQGEWTLPCVANIFTGLYSSSHGVYQPNATIPLKDNHPTLAELFQREGFLTFGFNNTYRINPLYGFSRGFNYFSIKPHHGKDQEIINSAVEQLRAFKEQNHFLYLHLTKVHSHTAEPPAWAFSTEVNCPIKDRAINVVSQNPNVHYMRYHPELVKRYCSIVKELDNDLKILYAEVERSYKDDEIIFVLASDHGAKFAGKESYFLGPQYTNVPLFVRSPMIPAGDDNSFIESIDIYSNLLHLAGIKGTEKSNSRLWPVLGAEPRRYVTSESIYFMNYNLCIRDKEFEYRLECLIKDGRPNLATARKSFFKKHDNKSEISNKHRNEFEEFDKFAFTHISSISGNLYLDFESNRGGFWE